MGKVAVTYRIMPEDTEVDLIQLEKAVREVLGAKLAKLEQKDVAYGLKSLMAIVVMDDASGASEAVESSLGALPGVSTVETQDMSLI